MIGLRLRAAWLSLALLVFCAGQASAQVQATLSASFTPSTVLAGGSDTSTYHLTVTNPNGTALTGIAVGVTFPSGITRGSIVAGSCSGSGSFSSSGFSFTINTLAAGQSCDLPAFVQADSSASGAILVTSSTVTSTQVGTPGPAASATLTVTPLAATSFSVVAGTPVQVFFQDSTTVTCLDQRGNTFTSYAGTVNFSSTDPNFISSSGQGVSLTNGVGTFNVVFKTAGTQTVTATDSVTPSIAGTSNPVTATPGPTQRFIVSALSPQTAGTGFSFTVTAVDLINNTTPSYSGTVTFSASDGLAILPANSTLTNGVGTFSATLHTPGSQTITATDTVTSSVTGTSDPIQVNAVSAPTLAQAFGAGSIAINTTTSLTFTITNPNSSTSLQSIGFPDTLPAGLVVATPNGQSGTCLSVAGGVLTAGTPTAVAASGSISLAGLRLAASASCTFVVNVKGSTAGTKTNTTGLISSTESGLGSPSTASLTVSGVATHFSVTATSPQTAGSAFNFTVTALDSSSLTDTAYSGTVHFTSTDGAAVLPANSTLTNGVGTFSATLKTAGSQSITSTDTVTSSISGTSSAITVNPGAATHFNVAAPASVGQDFVFSFTVTALDQFNNTATGYAGFVHLTSTDGQATLCCGGAQTSIIGQGLVYAVMETTGNQTITATDTVNASITGTSGSISVIPATTFTVTTLADSGAGSLRAAINSANATPGVNITFDVTGIIHLLSPLPKFIQSTNILGPGASSLAIDGGGAVQVFNVGGGIQVKMSGLTIQNGRNTVTPGGGGITNEGLVNLVSCVVTGNVDVFGAGGGIFNNGSLFIDQSTVSNNDASGAGGFGSGGGLFNASLGSVSVQDSTFSGNTAHGGNSLGGVGGAIYNDGNAVLFITGSTIAGNNVTDPSNSGSGGGGAVYTLNSCVVNTSTISGNSQTGTQSTDSGGGIVALGPACSLKNTILAGNTDSSSSAKPDGSTSINDGGNNLIGISTGITGITNGVNGNQIGTSGTPLDPQLGALANNGGPTQTMLPSGNSPALGAGNPAGFVNTATDQRGTGFLRLRNGVIDIGAVQLQGIALTATAGTPQSAGIGATFATNLAARATESCAACTSAVPGVTVTLTPPGSGPSGTFAGGVHTAITNSIGVATAQPFTANMIGGPYSVTASATTPDQASPASTHFALTNTGGGTPVLTVTANNATKAAGAPLPTFSATITGFINGDTLAVVSGAPSLTTTATANSPAGSYPIIAAAGTLSAANYTFAFVNGTLTVTTPPQPATITIVSGSGQSGALGSPLAAPLVVVVRDGSGNPVSGVLVSFTVFSGSATLSAAQVATGLDGKAQITATPTVSGTTVIVATASGISKVATFFETGASPGPPAQISVLPSALNFTAIQDGGNPLPASIAVSNTGAGTLPWNASASGNPSWLKLNPLSGSTPAVITASIDTTGLMAGSYQSTITVTSGSLHQTVAVTLTVAPPVSAEFALSPAAVIVNAAAGSTTAITRVLQVSNAGTGTLAWTAAADPSSPWLSVSPASGSSAAGKDPSTITVQINPSGLAAGQHLGNIAFTSPGVATANVAVVVNLSALPDLISSVPVLEFHGLAGSSFAPQTLLVSTTPVAAVSFNATAAVATGLNWLTLSGANGATPGSISVSVNTNGLAAGYYVGYISVGSAGARNALVVPVVLDLGSANTPGTLSASPGGVLLTGPVNSLPIVPLGETIAISSDSGSFAWNAVALAGSGGTWLAVTPASGHGNGSIKVTASVTGLAPGSYSGQVLVSATGTSNAILIIPVTLIVSSGGTPVTPANTLQPIQPAGDFVATVGVPVALEASILSPTGTQVLGATVEVAFTTGDAPVILTDVGGGTYTGVWIPIHSGAASLLFTSPNSPAGVVTGVVLASNSNPAFSGAGIVNAAPMISGAPLGIGSIAALFGVNLASDTASAAAFPLPLKLGGVSVTINGIPAPLFYASPLQINFLVPYELAGQTTATILVSTANGVAEITGVPITPQSPGLFLTNAAGDPAVIHANGQPVSPASPAAGGEVVEIFATGLGPVSNAPADNAAAPADPLAMNKITPRVIIGGVDAEVKFAGLAPGFAGLNQINVVVPTGLPPGPTTLTIAVGPLFGNTAVIQVR